MPHSANKNFKLGHYRSYGLTWVERTCSSAGDETFPLVGAMGMRRMRGIRVVLMFRRFHARSGVLGGARG